MDIITGILAVGILLLISVLISRVADKMHLPVLVLFLGVGIMGGSEGFGGIEFNNYEVAQAIGNIALCFILFSGGMDTKYQWIKPVMWKGITLSTAGVLITALLLGVIVYYITPLDWVESMLLGSIVSSTDAAAVFSIFRSRGSGLKRNLRPTLELESGSNDPMAYFLVISFISMLSTGDSDYLAMSGVFIKGMLLGGVMGWGIGKASVWLINKVNLFSEGLYWVMVIALMLVAYSFTDVVGGNGFLAIYISGMVLGNESFTHKRSLVRFYDGIAWLMQILMFISLGLLISPSEVLPVIWEGLIISAALIFVVRPVAVFLCLSWFGVCIKDMLFVSWVGLKGAVPIIFATYVMVGGFENASLIFHIVFCITLTSLLLQGTSMFGIARWLNLTIPEEKHKKTIIEFESESIKSVIDEVEVKENWCCVGQSLMDLDLPKTALIVLIERKGKHFTPNGNTKIERNDRLTVLADTKINLDKTYKKLMSIVSE